MKVSPFLIDKDALGEKLQPLDDRKKAYDEEWLRGQLLKYPDILPVAEIEAIFQPLIPIGREVITETGNIDALFISHRGYLVLVETKLWRNPQAKREVVAQAIGYGSSISNWSYDRLNETVRTYTKGCEGVELDLTTWVEQRCGPVEGGRDFFEDTVAKNLRLGRFLILIVGDKIHRSVVEMLAYLNRYPHLATTMALVELNCYRWRQTETWPLLVVPSVVARTEIVERSVVQVTVKSDGRHTVEVDQEKARDTEKTSRGVALTEEAFWELLEHRSPDHYRTARDLIDRYRRDGIEVSTAGRKDSIFVELNVEDSEQKVPAFYIDTGGNLRAWPSQIKEKLKRAKLDTSLAEPYEAQLRSILKMRMERKEFSRPISKVNIDEFTSAVDAFITSIQSKL
jgi:hypothetical protein